MSKRARRMLISLAVLAVAALIVVAAIVSPGRRAQQSQAPPQQQQQASQPADGEGVADEAEDATTSAAAEAEADAPAQPPPAAAAALSGLRAVAPPDGEVGFDTPPAPLGSLDPSESLLRVDFSRIGAGIERVTLSTYWQTAAARRQAERHYRAVAEGVEPSAAPPLPPDDERYVLQAAATLGGTRVPTLATHSVIINGQWVPIYDFSIDEAGERVYAWAETAPGRFETRIVNDRGEPVLEIFRQWTLRPDLYGLELDQRVTNVSGQPLSIEWVQYGPGDMPDDRSPYVDPRRYRFGYALSKAVDPNEVAEINPGRDLMLMRNDVLGLLKDGEPTLWPNRTAIEEDLRLSWFASENRYFALAVHPPYQPPDWIERTITETVQKINALASPPTAGTRGDIFTELYSPEQMVDPGASVSFKMGVFAGPLDREILGEHEPYRSLNMDGLILYQMSTWCAFCTFQWLAHLLMWFLSLIEMVLHDWALAIILLVVVVRALLHPITKRSQISMNRFGRAMQAMKPEMDKLQQKYANEPKKIQQEQIRLMREHGVSPLGCLGFLPLILQTPIWIALYAVLFFAIELRHEPAFYGFFQLFWGWTFLSDLSSSDLFIPFPGDGVRIPWFWGDGFLVRGFNLLPILMGVVFFIQQKYMTPPTAGTLSEEQIRQQKIMKVMMVVLFPVMLYNAPSGLTLYIMTSSCLGIIESRYIRRHMDELDKNPQAKSAGTPWWMAKSGKPKDAQSRAFAAAIERAKAKREQRQQRSFKKRK